MSMESKMIDYDISKEIKSITSREKMIRYLDGYSAKRMEELDERKIKRPLVKSYMLEHVGDTGEQKKVTEVLGVLGIETEQIDENIYRISDTRENGGYEEGMISMIMERSQIGVETLETIEVIFYMFSEYMTN